MNIKRFDLAQLPPGLALATGGRAFARSETPCAGSLVHALNEWLPADALHEVFAAKPLDRASGWGFALLLAARLAAGRSLFFVRQGRRGQGRLYPPGLAELGMDPELCFQLHAPDTLALLRATADIARSGAAGAVLAEIEGNPRLFDLTASSRLALAAEKSGTAVLLLRVAAHEEPGAAYSRWGVVSAASPSHPFVLRQAQDERKRKVPEWALALPPSPSPCCATAGWRQDNRLGWRGIQKHGYFMSRLSPPHRSGTVQGRRHLAAYFPWLPAERLIRANTAPPDTPFALVEKQKGAMRLVALSQAAHLLGLVPGLPLADARARVPELLAFDHDPAADAALLGRLAEACLRYTPRVMVAPLQGLILDISGCHHLYDSNLSRAEKWLSDDLARRLGETRLTVRIACATASDAALALATFGLEEDAVHRLPVVALDCAPAVHHALQRAGLNHIGDLASRPRTILASRFGEDVTYRLARLLGEVDSPIIPRRSRPAVLCEARFAEPIGP